MAVASPKPGMLVRIARRRERVWSLPQALSGLALEERNAHDLGAIAAGGAVLDERPPGGDELGQLVQQRALRRAGFRLQQRAQAGEQGGIDPVGLGEPAGRLGKAAGLARIDLGEGQPCRTERALEAPVIGAGGLEHDALDGLAREPAEQRLVPGRVVGDPSRRAARMQVDVEVVFCDVDARDLC